MLALFWAAVGSLLRYNSQFRTILAAFANNFRCGGSRPFTPKRPSWRYLRGISRGPTGGGLSAFSQAALVGGDTLAQAQLDRIDRKGVSD